MPKVENNNVRNEIGLTKSEMRFWLITLVLVGALLMIGWIDTLVRWG